MFGKIESIIKEKNLKLSDCDYHTMRSLENGGKIRALVLKGEKIAHVEYICPNCKNYEYKTIEWKQVSKGAKYRFTVDCGKCGFKIKVEKLKK
ncbi:MAG: hypothetical protein QXF15_01515 [Candidatus Aenigmatarchaeota archaeon]|nr:hypothetical protein [Candidatus Aenigmarchaeota archaeon]